VVANFKGFPKINFLGDRRKAKKIWRRGVFEYNVLADLMERSPRKIKQQQRKTVFSDGTIIKAIKYFNEGYVEIFVPPISVPKPVPSEVEIHDYVLAIRVGTNSKKYSFLWDMRNHKYYYITDPSDPTKTITYPCTWNELEDFIDLYEYKEAAYSPPEERLLYPCFDIVGTPFGSDDVAEPAGVGGEQTHFTYCGDPPVGDWSHFADYTESGTVVENDVVPGCGTFVNTRIQDYSITGKRQSVGSMDNEFALSNVFTEDMEAYREISVGYDTGLPPPDKWGYISFHCNYYEILTDAGNGEPYCFRTTKNIDHSNTYDRAVYISYGGCPEYALSWCTGSGTETTQRTLITPHKTFTYRPYSWTSAISGPSICGDPHYGGSGTTDRDNEITSNLVGFQGNYTNHIMVQSIWNTVRYRDHNSVWVDLPPPGVDYWTHDFSNIAMDWGCRFLYNIYTDAATDQDPREQAPYRSILENVIEALGYEYYNNEEDFPEASFRILDITGEFKA